MSQTKHSCKVVHEPFFVPIRNLKLVQSFMKVRESQNLLRVFCSKPTKTKPIYRSLIGKSKLQRFDEIWKT